MLRLRPRRRRSCVSACCEADGRLLHTWRHGKAKLDAYLGRLRGDGQRSHLAVRSDVRDCGEQLTEAARLLDVVLKHFGDPKNGGFFYTADDHEQLIARNKDATDASVPSASGLAATALARLGKLTGNRQYADAAEGALRTAAGLMQQAPDRDGTGHSWRSIFSLDPPTKWFSQVMQTVAT